MGAFDDLIPKGGGTVTAGQDNPFVDLVRQSMVGPAPVAAPQGAAPVNDMPPPYDTTHTGAEMRAAPPEDAGAAANLLHGVEGEAAGFDQYLGLAGATVAGAGDAIRAAATGAPNDHRAQDFMLKHGVDYYQKIKDNVASHPTDSLLSKISYGIGQAIPAGLSVAMTGGASAPEGLSAAVQAALKTTAAGESFAVPSAAGQAASGIHEGKSVAQVAHEAQESIPENMAFAALPASFRGPLAARIAKGAASAAGLSTAFDAAKGKKPTPEELATSATLGGIFSLLGGRAPEKAPARAHEAPQEGAQPAQGEAQQNQPVVPKVVTRADGTPFKTVKGALQSAASRKLEGYEAVPVKDGYVLREKVAQPKPQSAETPAFTDPHEERLAAYQRKAQAYGLTPAQIDAFRPQDVREHVTGFHKAEDRVATLKRAQDFVETHQVPAHYVEADIANLAGMNEALGHSGANEVYRALTDILHGELEKTGATVVPFRHGGDEVSAVIVGAKPEQIDAALKRATDKARAYTAERGLDKIPHTKGRNAGAGLYASYSEIRPGETPKTIFSRADKAVEDLKRGRNDVNGEQTAQAGNRPEPAGAPDQGEAGGTGREAGPESAGVQQPAERTDTTQGADGGEEPTARAPESPAQGEPPAQGDLIGGKSATAQDLHDEALRRDRARNSGQQSAETGNPNDLFSQARQQVDLEDQTGKPAPKQEPVPVEKPKVTDGESLRKAPWQMTRGEWNRARDAVRPDNAQRDFTRASGSQAVARAEELGRLLYGVHDEASAKLRAASKGDVKMPPSEAMDLLERVNTRVTHRDVVEKALKEGKPVPKDVLADYPDLKSDVAEQVKQHLADAEGGTLKFARGSGKTTGSSVADIRSALHESLGSKLDRMEKSGALKIVQHESDLLEARGLTAKDLGGIRGMFDGKQMWLVADRLTPDSAMGALLHEGSHESVTEAPGMKEMLGVPFDSLVSHFNRLHDAGDEHAVAAARTVEKVHTPADLVDEERIAHFVENVHNAETEGHTISGKAKLLYRRIISALRAWYAKTPFAKALAKRGISLDLKPEDFVALARQAVASKGGEGGLRFARDEENPDQLTKQENLALSNRKPITAEEYDRLAKDARVTLKDEFDRRVQSVKDAYHKWFPDMSEPQTKFASDLLARETARREMKEAQFSVESVERRKLLARLSDKAKLQFMISVDSGQHPPVMGELAGHYRTMTDEYYREESAAGVEVAYREHYFPHYYHDPKAFKAWQEQRYGKGGKAAFQKVRFFSTLAEAIEAGHKPISMNPEDLIQMRYVDHARIMMRHNALESLKKYGLLNTEKVPGTVQFTTADFGTYYVPEQIANILNNSIFKESLWTEKTMLGSLFRGIMEAKQILVPIRLGLSAFHLLHVYLGVKSAHGVAEAMNAVIDKPLTVDTVERTAKSIAMQLSTAGETSPFRLNEIRKAWEGRKTNLTADEALAIKYMIDGGFSFKNPLEYRSNAARNFLNAIDDRKVFSTAVHLVPTLLRAMQYPIMDVAVPAMKLQAYLDGARKIMTEHPELVQDDAARIQRLSRLREGIEERFGQMAYNRLFWNRRFLEVMQAAFLSFTWQYGFVKQFGGGMMDMARLAARVLPGVKSDRYIGSRAAYAVTYTALTALLGGLMTYAMTGKPPKKVKDLIYPIVGYDEDGNPQRVNTMFFTREYGAMYYHYKTDGIKGLGEMALYKASPMFETVAEQLQNRNFYGAQIYDPYASLDVRLKQRAEALFNNLTPISVGSPKAAGRTSQRDYVLSLLGASPAPSYVSRPSIVSKIYSLYGEFVGTDKTYAQAQESSARRQLRGLWESHKEKQFNQQMQADIEKFGWSERQIKDFYKGLYEPEGAYAFGQLPPRVQFALLEDMDKDQRATYMPYIGKSGLKKMYLMLDSSQQAELSKMLGGE